MWMKGCNLIRFNLIDSCMGSAGRSQRAVHSHPPVANPSSAVTYIFTRFPSHDFYRGERVLYSGSAISRGPFPSYVS